MSESFSTVNTDLHPLQEESNGPLKLEFVNEFRAVKEAKDYTWRDVGALAGMSAGFVTQLFSLGETRASISTAKVKYLVDALERMKEGTVIIDHAAGVARTHRLWADAAQVAQAAKDASEDGFYTNVDRAAFTKARRSRMIEPKISKTFFGLHGAREIKVEAAIDEALRNIWEEQARQYTAEEILQALEILQTRYEVSLRPLTKVKS